MSLRHVYGIARNEFCMIRADPLPTLLLIGMPLALMAFIQPASRAALVLDGHTSANGAEQAVPGMAVMFAFFLVGNIGFAFFRDHGWNTWDRLRSSRASAPEILAGKIVVPLLLSWFQLATLLALGGLLFDVHVTGSPAGIVVISGVFSMSVVSMGVALVAICRTVMQVNVVASLGAIVLGGLGGALTPMSATPAWARDIAPVTPSYWAMRGYRAMILQGSGFHAVLLPTAVLLGFTVAFTAVALTRFRFDQAKTSWA